MENVIVVSFDTRSAADHAVEALRDLEAGPGIDVRALAVMDRSEDGSFRMVEASTDIGVAGRVAGAGVGAVAGGLAGPLAMLVGGLTGLAAGGVVDAKRAYDAELIVDAVSGRVTPGRVAVVAEVDEESPDVVDDRMRAIGGDTLRWPRTDVEDQLRGAETTVTAAERARQRRDGGA